MSRKTTVDELRGLMLQNTKAALESIESLRSENARLRVALTEAKTELHQRAAEALKPDPRVAVDLGAGYFDGGMALIDGDCPKCGMSSMLAAYFDPERHRCADQRGEVEG